MDEPWEHPDWYDLHDDAWTAGSEREPEHYREFVLSLPPLDSDDHLVDIGAGTGKLSGLIAKSYPGLGNVTLIEPNEAKLDRALGRVDRTLPNTAQVSAIAMALGQNTEVPDCQASLVTIGSVLMPIMELGGGTLGDGLTWLRKFLAQARYLLAPGGWLYDLETLAAPWARGSPADPVRRLFLPELLSEFERIGLVDLEVMYRVRDRVIVRGRKPGSPDQEPDSA